MREHSTPTSKVVSVIDMMTGQPLKFTPTEDGVRVALARPIADEAGQARVRTTIAHKESRGYCRVRDAPGPSPDLPAANRKERQRADALGDAMLMIGSLWTRNAVALAPGYRVVSCSVATQVLALPDGRTQVSFFQQDSSGVT